jgi:hypothetical protein
MICRVLDSLTTNDIVCFVLYGHPGVFVYPSHEVIRRAKLAGHDAQMLPGISAEDCLFADIGIDPARLGCCTFEATDFLLYGRVFDPRSYLILWQVGLIGDITFKLDGYDTPNVEPLVQRLSRSYPLDHDLIVYEASQYAVCAPRVDHVSLQNLASEKLTAISTLVVPPAVRSEVDMEMADLLGIKDFITRKIS